MKRRENSAASLSSPLPGTVERRSGAVNENLKTGTMEVRVDYLRVLSRV